MELDSNTLAIAGGLGLALIVEMRLLRRELKIWFAALHERSRRRELRRLRSDSSMHSLPSKRRSDVEPPPNEFAGEEDTDIHHLVEIEREHLRARRKTGRQRDRAGDRPPRPGTHSDKPYED